ncbi:MAG: glycoside hydrolase family 3 protein [Acidimicrobiia bacterium]|nr:glycoside hydrolase family 3 protein [Acidimicrobiia bacterium]
MRRRWIVVFAGLAAVGSACSTGGGPVVAEPVVTAPEPTVERPTVEPTPTPAPTPSATPTPDPRSCIAAWPLEVRVAQLQFPLVAPGELGAATELVRTVPIGGVTLLGDAESTLAASLADLRAAAGAMGLIIAIDEEGGRVQRLAGLLGPLPSAQSVAGGSVDEARELAAAHAGAMADLGITMNLAPVADVGSAAPIGNRSYGDDVDSVVAYAAAVTDGIDSSGLTAVIKHFPGHGAASADSHVSVATTPPLAEMRSRDLVAFGRLISDEVPEAVMVGHLVVPDLTEGLPATLSPAAVDGILRAEFGFDGLVITDAMNMGAITTQFEASEAVEMAIGAGVDLVMIESITQVEPLVAALIDAVGAGRLSEAQIDDSVERVLATKQVDPCKIG